MTPGYVLDTPYANTFFQELSPAWLNYARAVNGVPGTPLDRPFTLSGARCGPRPQLRRECRGVSVRRVSRV